MAEDHTADQQGPDAFAVLLSSQSQPTKRRKSTDQKEKYTTCPVCHTNVPKAFLDSHTEDCLGRSQKPSQQNQQQQSPRKVPKTDATPSPSAQAAAAAAAGDATSPGRTLHSPMQLFRSPPKPAPSQRPLLSPRQRLPPDEFRAMVSAGWERALKHLPGAMEGPAAQAQPTHQQQQHQQQKKQQKAPMQSPSAALLAGGSTGLASAAGGEGAVDAFAVLRCAQVAQVPMEAELFLEGHGDGSWACHWRLAGTPWSCSTVPEEPAWSATINANLPRQQQQQLQAAAPSAAAGSSKAAVPTGSRKLRLQVSTNVPPRFGGDLDWDNPLLPSNGLLAAESLQHGTAGHHAGMPEGHAPAWEQQQQHAAMAEAGVEGVAGGSTSSTARWRGGGPGVLISALQKSVRRGYGPSAASIALELLKDPKNAEALARRLAIICLEDGLLHPQLPLVVWTMLALGKGYQMGGHLANALLDITHQMASIPFRDHLPHSLPASPAAGVYSAPATWHAVDAALGVSTPESILVKSILIRAAYGGMPGDKDMLLGFAGLWTARFSGSTLPPPPPAAAAPAAASRVQVAAGGHVRGAAGQQQAAQQEHQQEQQGQQREDAQGEQQQQQDHQQQRGEEQQQQQEQAGEQRDHQQEQRDEQQQEQAQQEQQQEQHMTAAAVPDYAQDEEQAGQQQQEQRRFETQSCSDSQQHETQLTSSEAEPRQLLRPQWLQHDTHQQQQEEQGVDDEADRCHLQGTQQQLQRQQQQQAFHIQQEVLSQQQQQQQEGQHVSPQQAEQPSPQEHQQQQSQQEEGSPQQQQQLLGHTDSPCQCGEPDQGPASQPELVSVPGSPLCTPPMCASSASGSGHIRPSCSPCGTPGAGSPARGHTEHGSWERGSPAADNSPARSSSENSGVRLTRQQHGSTGPLQPGSCDRKQGSGCSPDAPHECRTGAEAVGEAGQGVASTVGGGGGRRAASTWLQFLQQQYSSLAAPDPQRVTVVGAVSRDDLPLAAVDFHVAPGLTQHLKEQPQLKAEVRSMITTSAAVAARLSGPDGFEGLINSTLWCFRSSINRKAWLQLQYLQDSAAAAAAAGAGAGVLINRQLLEAAATASLAAWSCLPPGPPPPAAGSGAGSTGLAGASPAGVLQPAMAGSVCSSHAGAPPDAALTGGMRPGPGAVQQPTAAAVLGAGCTAGLQPGAGFSEGALRVLSMEVSSVLAAEAEQRQKRQELMPLWRAGLAHLADAWCRDYISRRLY